MRLSRLYAGTSWQNDTRLTVFGEDKVQNLKHYCSAINVQKGFPVWKSLSKY